METLILAFIVVSICFIGFGVGVFFFGKMAKREQCGTVPEAQSHEDCPSQKMGICPVVDTTGVVKMAHRARISYTPHHD